MVCHINRCITVKIGSLTNCVKSFVDLPIRAISGNTNLGLSKITGGQKTLFLLGNLLAVVPKGLSVQNADDMI